MLAALRRRCGAHASALLPSRESLDRIYDTHATNRMIPAHGTYVAPRLLHAAERSYLHRNNEKKREAPVESSNPIIREMIHGLCSLYERHARLRHGQTRT